MRDLLDEFLERRATVSHEDRSPSVQRFREMIGRDEKMLVVFEWIRTAAKSDISVLILGPTGSGKEVVARMIHELSRRGTNKFQAVNCAALPDTLFESEIFGYEKGAFTGAHDRKPGRLELANNGTLFLDEIGDMSLIAQAKLLRVLEERRFERLGGNTSIEVNFRLISATNRPLDQFVRDSRFREDLYYRVNAFSIRLPSLRERTGDIPVLAQRFLARYCAANGLPLDGKIFAKEAVDLLHAVSLAGQHPRARKHGLARRAVVARAASSGRATSSSSTRAKRRSSRPGSGCRRSPKPSAPTSSACSRACSGTRSRRPACSKSAAARSIGRSSNTDSRATAQRLETDHEDRRNRLWKSPFLAHSARQQFVRTRCSKTRHFERLSAARHDRGRRAHWTALLIRLRYCAVSERASAAQGCAAVALQSFPSSRIPLHESTCSRRSRAPC